MKHIPSIIAQSLFAILLSGSLVTTAHAQYGPGITVDIPFAFSADSHEVAAGTYRLQLVSDSFLMSFRNVKTGGEQVITVRPEEARQISAQGRLTFQVCEGRSYLTEIHVPGTTLYSETVNVHNVNHAKKGTCSNEGAITIALR